MLNRSAIFTVMAVSFLIAGCAGGGPKGFLKLSEESLAKRQLQMRQYETRDEERMLAGCAGTLQDLGFILGDSETKIGFIAASKKADATDKVKAVAATIFDILSAIGGEGSDLYGGLDGVQKVRASLIIKPSLDGRGMVVRTTFQRIVWNKNGVVKKFETIDDPEIYQKFFASLHKAVFLDDQLVYGSKPASTEPVKMEPARPTAARAAAPLPSKADAEYQAAVILYNAEDYDGAWRKAYTALQANPQHWQSLAMIGNCQYSKGDRQGALVSYQHSLTINPNNPTLKIWVEQLKKQ